MWNRSALNIAERRLCFGSHVHKNLRDKTRDFQFTTEQEDFRQEVGEFLAENLGEDWNDRCNSYYRRLRLNEVTQSDIAKGREVHI